MQRTICSLLLLSLAMISCSKSITITVTNAIDQDRNGEIVEIAQADLPLNSKESFVLYDSNGQEIPYQLTSQGTILFPATIGANQSANYSIQLGTPKAVDTIAYCRFIPERMDDFAWENNRIGYRVYGPALQASDGPSSGVDIWAKRVDHSIINNWYRLNGAGQNYHSDRGEGLDCYIVGRTLGGGMCAPFANDKLWLGGNFVSYEIEENGPLRVRFKLTYAPLSVNTTPVIETRTITLDANSSFSKMEVNYAGRYSSLTAVAGLALHDGKGKQTIRPNFVAYWEDQSVEGVTIGNAIIVPNNCNRTFVAENHLLAEFRVQPNENSVYYFGAGWNQWGFPTEESWIKAVEKQAASIESPLKVTLTIQ